jgi:hypothetical protein
MSAKFKGVPYFKSLLQLRSPTARVQTRLKMFLRQFTLIFYILLTLLFCIPYWTTGKPVYLISTKGARWVWPVSRGCLLLLGTWSYLRICRRYVLPYTRICNCFLDYDYVLHIVNLAILYEKISFFFLDTQFRPAMGWTLDLGN